MGRHLGNSVGTGHLLGPVAAAADLVANIETIGGEVTIGGNRP